MNKNLVVTKDLSQDVVSIALRGFIDAYTYKELEQTISRLFNQKQYKIVIDMSRLDYISSVGVGILVGAVNTAKENKGNVVLMRPKPEIRQVLDLLGMTQVFTITDNTTTTLKAFI